MAEADTATLAVCCPLSAHMGLSWGWMYSVCEVVDGVSGVQRCGLVCCARCCLKLHSYSACALAELAALLRLLAVASVFCAACAAAAPMFGLSYMLA